jgi:hypothetical protein
VHRLLGTYRDSIPAYASTTTFATVEEYLDVATSASSSASSDQAARLGGRARRCGPLPTAPRARRRRRRPDVRRFGRLRPPEREYVGRALGEASTAGTRSRCASSASPRIAGSLSASTFRCSWGDLRREPSQHRRLHRSRLRYLRQDEREPPRRDDRRDAHRPPGRLVPSAGGSARTDRDAVHLCMSIPNCTYYESLVTSKPATRDPRVGPDGMVHAPTEPGIALPASSGNTREPPQLTTRMPRNARDEGGRIAR